MRKDANDHSNTRSAEYLSGSVDVSAKISKADVSPVVCVDYSEISGRKCSSDVHLRASSQEPSAGMDAGENQPNSPVPDEYSP